MELPLTPWFMQQMQQQQQQHRNTVLIHALEKTTIPRVGS
jgi:hypothetical protein